MPNLSQSPSDVKPKKNILDKDLTNKFLSHLQTLMSPQSYKSWIEDILKGVTYLDSRNLLIIYILKGESPFYKDYLKQHHAQHFHKVAEQIFEKPVSLIIKSKE